MATGTASEAPRATCGSRRRRASPIDRAATARATTAISAAGSSAVPASTATLPTRASVPSGRSPVTRPRSRTNADRGRQHGAADQPGDDVVGLGDEARHGDGAGDEGDRRQDPRPLLGDVGGALVGGRQRSSGERRPRRGSGCRPRRPRRACAVDSSATTGAHDAASTATVEPARWPLRTASAGERREGDGERRLSLAVAEATAEATQIAVATAGEHEALGSRGGDRRPATRRRAPAVARAVSVLVSS